MSRRLKATLPEGWSDETGFGSKGVLTFIREGSKAAGILQISLAAYEGREVPTEKFLEEMAIRYVILQNLGRLDECSGGACSTGHFGSAVFWSQKAPRSQIWFISNGVDLITATHVCRAEPDPAEVQEAEMIVETVEIVEK
jgi:hypothetical protein